MKLSTFHVLEPDPNLIPKKVSITLTVSSISYTVSYNVYLTSTPGRPDMVDEEKGVIPAKKSGTGPMIDTILTTVPHRIITIETDGLRKVDTIGSLLIVYINPSKRIARKTNTSF